MKKWSLKRPSIFLVLSLDAIRETSIRIERLYEALDLFSLPKACFEE